MADDGVGADKTEASALDDFLTRWEASGAAERANYGLFLTELCDVIGAPKPEPTRPDDAENAYVFEKAVTFRNPDGSTSTGRIDLYKLFETLARPGPRNGRRTFREVVRQTDFGAFPYLSWPRWSPRCRIGRP